MPWQQELQRQQLVGQPPAMAGNSCFIGSNEAEEWLKFSEHLACRNPPAPTAEAFPAASQRTIDVGASLKNPTIATAAATSATSQPALPQGMIEPPSLGCGHGHYATASSQYHIAVTPTQDMAAQQYRTCNMAGAPCPPLSNAHGFVHFQGVHAGGSQSPPIASSHVYGTQPGGTLHNGSATDVNSIALPQGNRADGSYYNGYEIPQASGGPCGSISAPFGEGSLKNAYAGNFCPDSSRFDALRGNNPPAAMPMSDHVAATPDFHRGAFAASMECNSKLQVQASDIPGDTEKIPKHPPGDAPSGLPTFFQNSSVHEEPIDFDDLSQTLENSMQNHPRNASEAFRDASYSQYSDMPELMAASSGRSSSSVQEDQAMTIMGPFYMSQNGSFVTANSNASYMIPEERIVGSYRSSHNHTPAETSAVSNFGTLPVDGSTGNFGQGTAWNNQTAGRYFFQGHPTPNSMPSHAAIVVAGNTNSNTSSLRNPRADPPNPDTPRDNDVKCGRGNSSHPQNRKFLSFVDPLGEEYQRGSEEEKKNLVRKVIMWMQTQGGRFMKCNKDGLWEEVAPETARVKVRQTLSEAPRSERRRR